MKTGSGRTVVMAVAIAWQMLNNLDLFWIRNDSLEDSALPDPKGWLRRSSSAFRTL